MAVYAYGVVPSDVDRVFDGVDSSVRAADLATVTELIEEAAAQLNTAQRSLDITPSTITETGDPTAWRMSRAIVRARAAGEYYFTRAHQPSEVAQRFIDRADRLTAQMLNNPESFFETWDENTHAGGPQANVKLTPLTPGSSSQSGGGWGEGGF